MTGKNVYNLGVLRQFVRLVKPFEPFIESKTVFHILKSLI